MRQRGSEQLPIFILFFNMEASSGFRGEAQREGYCLPELNQLLFMGKRGMEGYPLFNTEKKRCEPTNYFRLRF